VFFLGLYGGESAVSTLSRVGYILALIGGVLIVISGIFYLVGSTFYAFYSVFGALGSLGTGIIQLIIGIVCIVGARYVGNIVWAIVLLILGLIVGGPGGILVVIGALLGLVSALLYHDRP
jgi:hypothetical protein